MTGIIIGCLVGISLALGLNITIPPEYSVYSAAVILVIFDAVFGAVSSLATKKFDLNILATSIIFNSLAVLLLVYIGKTIGLELIFAAIVVLGARILKNFSIIRRFLLNKSEKKVTIEEEDSKFDF